MQKLIDRDATRRRIRYRIRKRLSGSEARPRLAVFRSDKHIYAQVIDDRSGKTVAQAKFFIIGEGRKFTGKVEFSEEEVNSKGEIQEGDGKKK